MTDPSGTWQSKFSRNNASGQAEETVATVVLVRGEDADGAAQWAYALIPAERYPAFKDAEEAGDYRLGDYGTVLHFGAGAEPPEEIRRQMAEEYGCNPRFEEELAEMLEEALEQMPNLDVLLGEGGTRH